MHSWYQVRGIASESCFDKPTRETVIVFRNCGKCSSDDLECYVVDNNGFVVISEDKVHTGKFFGEVDGTILESLIQHNIYRPIRIFDYQAICLEPEDDGSSARSLLSVSRESLILELSMLTDCVFQPLRFLGLAMNYIISQVAYWIVQLEIRMLWNPDWTFAYPQFYDDVDDDDYGPNEHMGSMDPNSHYQYKVSALNYNPREDKRG